MSQETRESRGGGTRTLRVKVRINPGSPNPVRVRPITLTNKVAAVVWHCPDLPEGARLGIIFPDDPRGPFYYLREYSESEVIGAGNRGPDETSGEYVYTVEISGALELKETAHVHNHATVDVPPGGPEELVDPPPQ